MTVDGRPRDPEGLSDLLDRMLSRVVHGPSLLDLRRSHLELRPTLPATGTGSCQPVTGPLDNQVVLEFGNGRQHVEEQPATLVPALNDVDAVFLIWPFFDSEEEARRKVDPIANLLGDSVPRVVYLSSQGVENDRHNFWSVVEDAIVDHVEEWTLLRPTGFAANARQWIPQITNGQVVRWPFGQMARPLIHEADIAAVAVEALLRSGHQGRKYVLTGPEMVTQEAQVHTIGSALDKDLKWEEISRDRAAQDFDLPDMMLDAWEQFIDDPEPITDEVRRLTGQPALSVTDWACDNVGEFL